jgi:hypothetical protein
MIGAYDVLIAGHARSRGLQIVTSNLSEFRRVDGLMSEDWLEPSPGEPQAWAAGPVRKLSFFSACPILPATARA